MSRQILLLFFVAVFGAQSASAGWWPFGKKKGEAEKSAGEERRRLPPSITESLGEEEGRAGAAPEASKPAESVPAGGSLPTEVVIKAEDQGSKLNVIKPPLAIEVDPYESIRPSLKPDESMLLAVSPMTVSWRRTHPDILYSDKVIHPWRMTFSPRPGIVFRPQDHLSEIMRRKIEGKEADSYGWSLTIADEEGRVFHHYAGSDDPPEELVWDGQNEQGEWIHAGRSYSAVYTFTDQSGSPHTGVAKPLLFRGIVHQEDSGLHISLDSTVLFGSSKASSEISEPGGSDLLRSAADLIKRRYSGVPISVRVFASTKELGDSQGLAIGDYLKRELMLSASAVTVDAARASYSEQRVEIVLLNR